ncbi:hypothetical protein [Croceicoccus ponticola]|uniref:hypothetical protein n=1 Tax=Croceicoccus ponticola TaxID=2217664 RepID=UPI0013E2BD96|nr:hypothetical protein [Croceicoccus ponticola]
MVKWLGELLSLLASLTGLVSPEYKSTSDQAIERKRKRAYEAWKAKHGSKWNEK